jgi:hypothetical protein
MSFKEELRKKIELDRLARKVTRSLGPSADEVRRVDKDAMRRLLEGAGYRRMDERDLELYAAPESPGGGEILVLDNGLAVYRTDVEDVAMRKSPTVKEMLSPRNVIRILKDDDVVTTRREASVARVHEEALERLNLSYTDADLDEIRLEGTASLDSTYPEGVVEAVALFAEILGWQSPPKAFDVEHRFIRGALGRSAGGEQTYGPAVIYDRVHNALRFHGEPVRSDDPEGAKAFLQTAEGKREASKEGAEAFRALMDAVKAAGRPVPGRREAP